MKRLLLALLVAAAASAPAWAKDFKLGYVDTDRVIAGYSKAKDPSSVAAAIAPLLKEPDCPVMLKQLAAFLNKRAGNLAAAAAIYSDIAATSRDEFYVRNARRELEKLAGRGAVK